MQYAGRGITALSLTSSKSTALNSPVSPSTILQNFTVLVTLRLDLPHVLWSDLQNIRELVHLRHLHLCEHVSLQAHRSAPPQDWAFARDIQTTTSPFHCLSSLASLKLELYVDSPAAFSRLRPARLLQPISCMTKLGALTLRMKGSDWFWDMQPLSQLSKLTSLVVDNAEQGLSTLVKLEHLAVAQTYQGSVESHTTFRMNILFLSFRGLAMLTSLRTLDCGIILRQHVLNLGAATALTGLTMIVDSLLDCSNGHLWSRLSKLPILASLDVRKAFLDVIDFRNVALMTHLTKLHFCGFCYDLEFAAEDVNRLSALTSLKHLHLEFAHSGIWREAIVKLDGDLRQLYNARSMHYLRIVSSEYAVKD